MVLFAGVVGQISNLQRHSLQRHFTYCSCLQQLSPLLGVLQKIAECTVFGICLATLSWLACIGRRALTRTLPGRECAPLLTTASLSAAACPARLGRPSAGLDNTASSSRNTARSVTSPKATGATCGGSSGFKKLLATLLFCLVCQHGRGGSMGTTDIGHGVLPV